MKLSQVFAFIRRSDDENDQLVPDAQHTPGPTSSRYGANNAHMADQTGSGYEEFFRDSIPCPTCRGLGRIHKDHEHELVAIIPVKDKRLKPRRTYIYVLLALGVCLLTGALLLFFLFPRNVTASHTDTRTLQPHNLVIDTEQKYVSFCIQNPYNITNNNFYSMDITGMQVSLIHDQRVVSKGSNSTILRIPMTSTVEHWVSINITFQGDEAYLVASCMDRRKWVHDVFMQFEFCMSNPDGMPSVEIAYERNVPGFTDDGQLYKSGTVGTDVTNNLSACQLWKRNNGKFPCTPRTKVRHMLPYVIRKMFAGSEIASYYQN